MKDQDGGPYLRRSGFTNVQLGIPVSVADVDDPRSQPLPAGASGRSLDGSDRARRERDIVESMFALECQRHLIEQELKRLRALQASSVL
jgi:hypothetical protein